MSLQRKVGSSRFWPLFLAAVVASLGFSLLFPDRAAACSCTWEGESRQEIAEQAFSEAAVVFEGQVVAIDGPVGPTVSSEDPSTVTLRVSETWKGAAGETLEVETTLDGASCGFPFEQGESYLVYASDGLWVHLCGGTIPLSDADEDLEVLGAGTAPGQDGGQYGQPSGEPPAGQPQQPTEQDAPCVGETVFIQELGGCFPRFTGAVTYSPTLDLLNATVYEPGTNEELGLAKDLDPDLTSGNFSFTYQELCEDFTSTPEVEGYPYTGLTAQEYYDQLANAQEQTILDPDGDGLACTDDDEAFLAGDDEETGTGDGQQPGGEDNPCPSSPYGPGPAAFFPDASGCLVGEPLTLVLLLNSTLADPDTGEELGILKDLDSDLSGGDFSVTQQEFCEDFPQPEGYGTFGGFTAQEYYEQHANAQERAILDPDGDGLACSAEPGGVGNNGAPPDPTDDPATNDNVVSQVAGGARGAVVYCYDTATGAVENVSQGRLPDTGGEWTVLLVLGTTLVGGGWFLVRRFSG